jgi:hypothetical protein
VVQLPRSVFCDFYAVGPICYVSPRLVTTLLPFKTHKTIDSIGLLRRYDSQPPWAPPLSRSHGLALSPSSVNREPFPHHFCTTFCAFLRADPCKSSTYDPELHHSGNSALSVSGLWWKVLRPIPLKPSEIGCQKIVSPARKARFLLEFAVAQARISELLLAHRQSRYSFLTVKTFLALGSRVSCAC